MNTKSFETMLLQENILSEDEEYMNLKHLEYFNKKLQFMLNELEIQKSDGSTYYFIEDDENEKLIGRRKEKGEKIREALEKIKLGTYGYCEGTGEEIGLERLEANPLAIYCIEEQERIEKEKRIYYSVED
ncbi:TraR/DksA family transcriptional regulator [Wolbachia endosymbiont of Chironomus riparius]|uniref:TraR/DksA family transcriptional regulator n=1 Tax=Wolbachia endosymbiont of Chironomus riparius TaxID=2883238 RepID=UPI00209D7719|nr:TraR/DksA C4-type zinc finger protein [Wolbachia endosymbiont of Chironomus riparius]